MVVSAAPAISCTIMVRGFFSRQTEMTAQRHSFLLMVQAKTGIHVTETGSLEHDRGSGS